MTDVLTFSQFCARHSYPTLLDDHGSFRYPHGISAAERRRMDRVLQERYERMDEARREYDRLVANGSIRPPTNIEQMIDSARGCDDNETTQAARRCLQRRGITW